MNKTKRIIALSAISALASSAAWADVVYMEDGRRAEKTPIANAILNVQNAKDAKRIDSQPTEIINVSPKTGTTKVQFTVPLTSDGKEASQEVAKPEIASVPEKEKASEEVAEPEISPAPEKKDPSLLAGWFGWINGSSDEAEISTESASNQDDPESDSEANTQENTSSEIAMASQEDKSLPKAWLGWRERLNASPDQPETPLADSPEPKDPVDPKSDTSPKEETSMIGGLFQWFSGAPKPVSEQLEAETGSSEIIEAKQAIQPELKIQHLPSPEISTEETPDASPAPKKSEPSETPEAEPKAAIADAGKEAQPDVAKDTDPKSRRQFAKLVSRFQGLEWKNLTSGYRFHAVFPVDGSTLSNADIDRILAFANKMPEKATIVVMGFADRTGDIYHNHDLSRDRAKAAERIVRTARPDLSIRVLNSLSWPGNPSESRRVDILQVLN